MKRYHIRIRNPSMQVKFQQLEIYCKQNPMGRLPSHSMVLTLDAPFRAIRRSTERVHYHARYINTYIPLWATPRWSHGESRGCIALGACMSRTTVFNSMCKKWGCFYWYRLPIDVNLCILQEYTGKPRSPPIGPVCKGPRFNIPGVLLWFLSDFALFPSYTSIAVYVRGVLSAIDMAEKGAHVFHRSKQYHHGPGTV